MAQVGAVDGSELKQFEIIAVNGVVYALLVSIDVGSLTVFELDSQGELSPVSQVNQGDSSFFAGVSVMKSITVEGTVYVALGGEDGLNLFAALPGGATAAFKYSI